MFDVPCSGWTQAFIRLRMRGVGTHLVSTNDSLRMARPSLPKSQRLSLSFSAVDLQKAKESSRLLATVGKTPLPFPLLRTAGPSEATVFNVP